MTSPPLIISASGSSAFLAPGDEGPLGTARARALDRGSVRNDDVLPLYTDGIVERPGTTRGEAPSSCDTWPPRLHVTT